MSKNGWGLDRLLNILGILLTLYFGLFFGSSRLVSRDEHSSLKGFGIEWSRTVHEHYQP